MSNVPHLQGGLSRSVYPPHTAHLTPEQRAKRCKRLFTHQAKRWSDDTPRYRVSASYKKLKQRSLLKRNTPGLLSKASKKIRKMRSWRADPYSAIFQDSEGKPLVCVFAMSAPPEKSEGFDGGPAIGAGGGTYHKYKAGARGHPGRNVKPPLRTDENSDGFKQAEVELAHEACQQLHTALKPKLNERDVRHLSDQSAEHVYTTWQGNGVEVKHRHPHDPPVPSADLLGRHGAGRFLEVQRYYTLTIVLAFRLACYFKVAFPDYYAQYQQAFDAGSWVQADPGPWLGRALVYKLQVTPHVDGLDDGPTAIFPTGSFGGGAAYLPDLSLKLEYRPGDIIIFFAGLLYHSVGLWKGTTSRRARHGLTPGRIGHVHFFHRGAFELLKDKSPGWVVRTCAGKYADGETQAAIDVD
ncbi:hypothetical protein ONZ45_g8719 [Pleurotus djamor]|nr:hypothetical protein ONZ45_g8719 [Pleurotus djamor]